MKPKLQLATFEFMTDRGRISVIYCETWNSVRVVDFRKIRNSLRTWAIPNPMRHGGREHKPRRTDAARLVEQFLKRGNNAQATPPVDPGA